MAKKITWEQVGQPASQLLSPAFVTNAEGQLVFTSGSVGTDARGQLPSDLESQCRNAFQNLITVLDKSGSSRDAILKVLLFISDSAYASTVNRVYREFFPNQPARSCIVVAFPNDALKVELECVAQVRHKPRRWFKL
ncbi:hypothetical protein HG536_0D05290 [Torulaspora globosa]|uniref:Uncharacterized protein n=1 Tax=Torulaspora globosa TaxID=48254 RepID=A0A7G3ZHM1_9SACH|nr:uncharacterized protein HG536_0D05290 [Torulaspora globosa]QLL33007.1 hypothetical protein HG536_0D05290 [Torulaspora globosa]